MEKQSEEASVCWSGLPPLNWTGIKEVVLNSAWSERVSGQCRVSAERRRGEEAWIYVCKLPVDN